MTSSRPPCSPRWATPRSPERQTLGAAGTRIAEQLGKSLMPWQQQVLDVALEQRPDTGKLAYREVVLTVPRQSGKTTLLLVLILLRALSEPRQNIRYTAQTGMDARKKWQDDWLPDLKASRFSSLFRTRQTNGHEALLFNNGSIQGLLATTEKSGHGTSLDLGIMDEAFAHADARLEQAIKPAMITRSQPQIWVVSTAGTPDKSPYLLEKVERGRALAEQKVTDSTAYFEWSAPDEADPADPETWWGCMPALGITTPVEAVAADFTSMELNEFERAYLNRWKSSVLDPVIPLSAWNALVDEDSELDGRPVFSFDVTPDRSSASIAVAGPRTDGRTHVEVVEHADGASWVPQRLSELANKYRPRAVVCDPMGPAGALLVECASLGIKIETVNATEHGQACGLLYDAVFKDSIRHRGDPLLVVALDGAVKRPLGDAWAWSRKNSAVDLSPLVAATLAHWMASHGRPKPPRIVSLGDPDL